jgi:hypothetical protein
MAWVAGMVIVTTLALAVGVAVLSAIASAIEVLPSNPGAGSEAIDDEPSPARAAGVRISHES